MIISVLNQKGGTGKTTIACNLAVAFKKDGYKVALVDADKQGTTATFRERRNEMQLPQIPMFQILTDTLRRMCRR
jgi:chromosome partitioning protein